MDHLPAPADPSSPLPEVPYLCEAEPYDGGDFLNYMARSGLPQANSPVGMINFRDWERSHPVEDKDIEESMQTWLFFGLLQEVLGKHGLYDVADYVEAKEDGRKCVHTKNLMLRLRRWTEIVRAWDEDQKAAELKHLQACLVLAEEALYLILAEHHANCNRAVTWSTCLILETLASAIDLAFVGPIREVTVGISRPDLNQAEKYHMMRNGWCIHEILAAEKEHSSNAARFYTLRLKKPDLRLRHDDCEEDLCKRLQIDRETYRPRHVKEDCECAWAGPTPREIARCLEEESFPVLRITGEELEKVQVEVVPYVKGMVYVALSHVWADGLGNPAANRLPQCQLLRLKRLVEEIRDNKIVHVVDESVSELPQPALVYPTESREAFIWCDTICCPVQDTVAPILQGELDALQSKAIASLRQIYLQASHTLVLDRSLEAIDFHGIDRLESAMRLFTSRWVRRVWTYQESGIAERLLIHFRDAIVDHRTIWGAMHHNAADKPEAHNSQLRRFMSTHCFSLRSWFSRKNERLDYRGPVWSLCSRRVSVPTDEALCLAAAYNLNVEAVANRPKDDRMQEFWTQLAGTSRGVSAFAIFNFLPRLSAPGYRWAPASILQTVKGGVVFEFVFREPDDPTGSLTTDGFRVPCPGWRLRGSGPPGRFPYHLVPASEPTIHYLRDPEGRWYSIWERNDLCAGRDIRLNRLWEEDREDESSRWHVILDICAEGQETQGRRGVAVTASRAGEAGPTIYHSEMTVWIRRLAPQWESLWEIVHTRMHHFRTDPKVTAISSFAEQGFSISNAWGRASAELFPQITYDGTDESTPPEMDALCKELISQVNETWSAVATDEKVLELLRSVSGNGDNLGTIILGVFWGRFAVAEEVFGEETEWVVD